MPRFLHLVMPFSIDIPGMPTLFWREKKEQWIWGRGKGFWEKWRKSKLNQDSCLERRVNLKKTKTVKIFFNKIIQNKNGY